MIFIGFAQIFRLTVGTFCHTVTWLEVKSRPILVKVKHNIAEVDDDDGGMSDSRLYITDRGHGCWPAADLSHCHWLHESRTCDGRNGTSICELNMTFSYLPLRNIY